MTLPISKSLGLLAGEFGVSLAGLDDDALNLVAIRFLMADTTSSEMFAEIVDDVRRAEGGGKAQVAPDNTPASEGRPLTPSADPAGPPDRLTSTGSSGDPARFPKFRFNATEATEAKYRARMALAHKGEDKRTGLYLVPRLPDLRPGVAHPACIAANVDGVSVCSRCAPILHDADCDCGPCDYFVGVQE